MKKELVCYQTFSPSVLEYLNVGEYFTLIRSPSNVATIYLVLETVLEPGEEIIKEIADGLPPDWAITLNTRTLVKSVMVESTEVYDCIADEETKIRCIPYTA